MTYFLGGLAGLVISLAAWLVVTHAIRPSIRFSELIAWKNYRLNEEEEPIYRVGIRNHHPILRFLTDRRTVVEVTSKAYLYCGPLQVDDPYNAQIELPMQVRELPRLQTYRMLRLEYWKSEELKSRLPQDLSRRLLNRDIALQELLRELPPPIPRAGQPDRPFIRVFVAGADSFTGVRRVFVSKPYMAMDIRHGELTRLSLNFQPYSL